MSTDDCVRLLLAEDNEDDAQLIIRHLNRAGIGVVHHRVQTADEMAVELSLHPPDVVISDNSMPQFDAATALRLLKTSAADIPFIVVSGQIGEEAAAALMRAGARDFILKDSLTRLAPAVQRELREAHERQEHRQAQVDLHSVQEQFRLLAEHLRDVVFRYRLRPTPALEYVSPAITDLTGQDPAAGYARPDAIFETVAPEDRDRTREAWHSPPTQPFLSRWRRPDGELAWVEQRLVPIYDPAGVLVAVEGILRDTTDVVRAADEREELARQLHQTERLDSLGQLAGGVAHDFNNLLNIITSYATFTLDELGPDHPAREDAEKILHAAAQAAALTRQLLLFSQLHPSHPEIVDLNVVVRDIERLLQRTIGEDIGFTIRLSPDIGLVSIERARLEQVIMNLVINARAAMPDGGQITIETGAAGLAPGTTVPATDSVCLTVTDTGCGMDEETQRRAFEPFFSTKGRGRGTGLGLATVYGVVKDAGGSLTLRSAPGQGTRFAIYLPTTSERPVDAPSDATAVSHANGHQESILVVEDDDGVREILRRILTRADYLVAEAPSREHALQALTAANGPIDLLLTDMVMPGLPAAKFLQVARDLRPTMPVICISGYLGDGRGGGLPPDVPLILKPFDANDLLRQVRAALDRAPAGSDVPAR